MYTTDDDVCLTARGLRNGRAPPPTNQPTNQPRSLRRGRKTTSVECRRLLLRRPLRTSGRPPLPLP